MAQRIPIFIDDFEIDATISETHQFDSDVTDHPVESGADVTDNVRVKPIIVTINGIVRDSPLGEMASVRQNLGPGVGNLPSDDFIAKVLGIRDAREPVSISTTLQTYDDMVLQSLTVPRDSKTGRAAVFTAVFKQVIFVKTDRSLVRVATPPAQGKTNLGNKASIAKPEPPAGYYNVNNPDDAKTSLLGTLVDGLGKTTQITPGHITGN